MQVSVSNKARCNVNCLVTFIAENRQRDHFFSSGNIVSLRMVIAPAHAVSDDLFLDCFRNLLDNLGRRPCNVKTLNEIDSELDNSLDFFCCFYAFSKCQDIIVM